jgi:hypothetical protein
MYRVSPDRRSYVFAQALQHQTHSELVYRPLQFRERSQLFIRSDNETLFVIAMCVGNPDCSL